MSSDRRDIRPPSAVLLLGLVLVAACGGSGEGGRAPSLTAVTPACGVASTSTRVTLTGTFPVKTETTISGGVTIDTTYRALVGETELTEVTWIDARTITAVVPSGLPNGVYAVTVESPFGSRATRAAGFQVQEQGVCVIGTPTLVIAAVVAPNGVTVGQQATVTARIKNGGPTMASGVVATITAPAASFSQVSSDAAPRDIASGGSSSFTWTYKANAVTPAEGVTFAVSASGTDAGGEPVIGQQVQTNVLVVNAPASLVASSSAPATVSLGQSFDFTLAVANTGAAAALAVPGLQVATADGGQVSAGGGPPGTAVTIAGGTQHDFTWSYTALAAGTVTFTSGVTGQDANTLEPLSVSPPPPVTVVLQSRPTLSMAAAALPSVVDAPGQTTVTATVSNGGDAAVLGVTVAVIAAPPGFTVSGSATSGPQDVPGHGAKDFTFTYDVPVGAGAGGFTLRASGGRDANDGAEVGAATQAIGGVAAAYSVGGSVAGLSGQVVLRLNGGDDLTVAGDGAFAFAGARVASGQPYAVTVFSAPASQSCTVAGGAGTMATAPVTTVVVTCAARTWSLTTAVLPAAGAGAVRCDGGACQAGYPHGTVVELTAVPATGYHFAGWSGDCAGAGTGACSLTMTAARSATATFALDSLALTTAVLPDAGAGAVRCDGGACQATYPYGTVVGLTAAPATGYHFTGWSGDCTGTGVCRLTMTAARSATASFALDSIALTTAVLPDAGAGEVLCDGGACQATYPYGTVVGLTAAPATGYHFTGWSGDCAGAGTGPCWLTMTAARSATASFALDSIPLTVTVLPDPGAGAVRCDRTTCQESYPYGTVVELTADPARDSQFDGWSGDCAGAGTDTCWLTMTVARSATASFSQRGKVIGSTAGAAGPGP